MNIDLIESHWGARTHRHIYQARLADGDGHKRRHGVVCVFFFHLAWLQKLQKPAHFSCSHSFDCNADCSLPTALPHATCGVICTLTLAHRHTHALRPNICSWHIDTVSMQRQMCCISCPSLCTPLLHPWQHVGILSTCFSFAWRRCCQMSRG